MNRNDRLHLLAEKQFLTEQIQKITGKNRLTKMSLESRLKKIETKLSENPTDDAEPARAELTFKGRPVVGSHGIFAEFGMKAVSCFSDAVSTLANVKASGSAVKKRNQSREQNQLLITRTALGSFGFELEEYLSDRIQFEDDSPISEALAHTQKFLQGTLGSDDDLADLAAETDKKALDKIRDFLGILAENDACFSLKFKENYVRFLSVNDVKTSLSRLTNDNLHEEEKTLSGEFRGFLPAKRMFEFIIHDENKTPISGKVDASIENIDLINKNLNKLLNVVVIETRVGSGKPRYKLIGIAELTD